MVYFMENLTIDEIIKATKGKLLCDNSNSLHAQIESITTNSREMGKNALFIPLHGEKIDAHKFIDNAFSNGAIATLTDEHDSVDSNKIYISVNNTLTALHDLAAYYRRKFFMPVVGITGSVGKTSTKEMISCALSSEFNVLKTTGNFNGQIGLPLTIFNLEKSHNVAVVEMGVSEFDEMKTLSNIALPTFAVMTNIGVTHIENFKSRDNILKEKFHITNSLDEKSILFVNTDDEYLSSISKEQKFKVVTFGIDKKCDFKAENIKVDGQNTNFELNFNGKQETIKIPVIGKHNVYNALAAIAVGVNLGISIEKLKDALLLYKTLNMRQCIYSVNFDFEKNQSKLSENGNIKLIDDSYNANPDSMRSAIEVLKLVGEKGRKVAVLADMLELGEESENLHFELGKFIAKNKIDVLITIGKEAINIAKGASGEINSTSVYSFHTNEKASEKLKEILQPKDTILIKGSRGMHTEEIVNNFIK
ncbi:MAG: UDP-N-acetylmuramoyl-tripeptide--D-alanyl-D-alanine ligase [Eubacteriales bacterium SKADARSKE-1]|nr:UDP-N-acetylmuramoyl-tripeptide--D-alanyl-D-alanine ligase [Eubacteriales bacterium SKADARSKE-1]